MQFSGGEHRRIAQTPRQADIHPSEYAQSYSRQAQPADAPAQQSLGGRDHFFPAITAGFAVVDFEDTAHFIAGVKPGDNGGGQIDNIQQ